MFVGYFVLGKTSSKIIYNQIFCSHFNFPPFAFLNISCNDMISMIWRDEYMPQTTKKASHVLFVKLDKNLI